MTVRWSTRAVDDLESICEFVERDSPEAARRIAQTICDGCESLSQFPLRGRSHKSHAGVRELVFAPLPYIAVYRVIGNAIEIIGVYHGARVKYRL